MLTLLALAVACSFARASQDSFAPPFHAGVDLVALNVTVTDAGRRFVGGLTEQDFAVFEDGVKQRVSFFAAGVVPIDLAIVLDTSMSMNDSLPVAQRAAIGLIDALRPGDRATVIEINNRANILHPLDDDLAAACEAIRGTRARGATALYNALYVAITSMARQSRDDAGPRRQAIVLLSDGLDTASLVEYDDVMERAKEAGIAVYTVSLSPPPQSTMTAALATMTNRYAARSQAVMRSFAEATGARAFVARTATELSGIYDTIADELAHQYTLGYVSRDDRRDGRFRRVTVRVTRVDAAPRTRTGYRAAGGESHRGLP